MFETGTLHNHPQIQQKLLEEKFKDDIIAIYATKTFGHLVTINQQVIVSDQDSFFFHEMMAHLPVFTHPVPKKIAVLGNDTGIINEILKHSSIEKVELINNDLRAFELFTHYFPSLASTQFDSRFKKESVDRKQWLEKNTQESFDIIILTQLEEHSVSQLEQYRACLHAHGLFALLCTSPVLDIESFNLNKKMLSEAGFLDHHLFHFPQPSYPSGWRFAILASKKPHIKRVREKDIYNRLFRTRYYNYDIHKAALVLPEFLLEPS